MSISIRVTGLFLGRPLNRTFKEGFRDKDTPKKIFARLDKKKVLGRRFFRGAIKSGLATFLLNGNRLDLPEALNDRLADGDEISVLSAIAGGRSASGSVER